ncbi:EamA family transporter [Acinetobacter sp. ANC 4558]|uniref:DMT family transporter n=1 Tax=Acinetobacter sp. ANC 4558 TaxID=1977876 RepID=UPI000A3308A5|nr:DMT family transporter [Acinetobacter sp. ANC 4558]OTG87625.1 EamA family transporter [Acinetobacter sp. ANC 4558]
MQPSQLNITVNYVLLILIWATTPLAIVWSVSDIYYIWALVLRFWLALPIAIILLLVIKQKLPLHSKAMHSYFAGAMGFIGSQTFTYVATNYLSSGMISLMFGLAPIIAGIIGFAIFKQNLKFSQWIGMLVAILGLVIICFSGSGNHVQPLGIFFMLCSVSIYVLSMYWVKYVNAQVQPMVQATGSILFSVLFTFLLIPFIWQHFPTHIPIGKSLFAIIYSVIMSSLVAMFCYFKLVQSISATTLSLATVITPMFAILIGAGLNHEKLSMMILIGASILIFGLFIYFYRDIAAQMSKKDKLSKS